MLGFVDSESECDAMRFRRHDCLTLVVDACRLLWRHRCRIGLESDVGLVVVLLNKQNEDEMFSYECAVWKYPLVTLVSCSDTLCAKNIEVAA